MLAKDCYNVSVIVVVPSDLGISALLDDFSFEDLKRSSKNNYLITENVRIESTAALRDFTQKALLSTFDLSQKVDAKTRAKWANVEIFYAAVKKLFQELEEHRLSWYSEFVAPNEFKQALVSEIAFEKEIAKRVVGHLRSQPYFVHQNPARFHETLFKACVDADPLNEHLRRMANSGRDGPNAGQADEGIGSADDKPNCCPVLEDGWRATCDEAMPAENINDGAGKPSQNAAE